MIRSAQEVSHLNAKEQLHLILSIKASNMTVLRTPAEVRQEFERRGLSIASWARDQGFSVPLVYQVLSSKKQAIRGQCHRIAVALTLKAGEVADLQDLPFSDTRPRKARTK